MLITKHQHNTIKKSLSNLFLAFFSLTDDTGSRDMIIRNIEYVNARTNLLHCIVNNTHVDITVNQISAFASIIFLEEADRLIGEHHLFKRSLILIKVH